VYLAPRCITQQGLARASQQISKQINLDKILERMDERFLCTFASLELKKHITTKQFFPKIMKRPKSNLKTFCSGVGDEIDR